jgi:hypothetical protein
MAVDPAFGPKLLHHLRASKYRVAVGALALVGLDVMLSTGDEDSWSSLYLFTMATFGAVAIAALVAAALVARRPAVRELLSTPGSAARVTIASRGIVRIWLRSGRELQFTATAHGRADVRALLRGHSPQADIVDA